MKHRSQKSGNCRIAVQNWKWFLLSTFLPFYLSTFLPAESQKNSPNKKVLESVEVKKSTITLPEIKISIEPVKELAVIHLKPKVDKRTNIQKLKDENWIVRRNAAISLGTEKNKKAVTPLIGLLKDQNVEVRRCVAVALGEIGDKQAVPYLVKALNDSDGGMVIDSADALGKFKDPSSVVGLKKLVVDGRPVVRIAALRTLISFNNDPEVQTIIVRMLTDEAEGVRILATQQTASLKLKSAVPNLTKNLSDMNPTVKIEAVKALAEIGDKASIEPLKKLLTDENPEVVTAAKDAISKIEDNKK